MTRQRSIAAGLVIAVAVLALGTLLLSGSPSAPGATPGATGDASSSPFALAASPGSTAPGASSAATPTVSPGPASATSGTASSPLVPSPLPSPPAATAVPGATPPPSAPGGGATGLPAFRHIYLIVMENKEYGSIVGDPAAPFLNGLIAGYGLATRYDAVAHPSEPNYLALFSGSTQGVTDDGIHDLGATNLADQLDARGRSWRVFAQNVPLGCYTGYSASGGEDGPGTYARKHEPAISFIDIARDPARCARITDFTHFDPAAAAFELIVPNMCNDMHDCSVATGDAFLRSFVPRITGSPAFADSVLFITWDEGSSSLGGGGHVATLVISPLVRAGMASSMPHDHYSLLRTIEDAWGLGCLGHACSANDMREFFRA